jgi:hypothetical protein
MYRQPNSLHNTRNNNKRQRETADYLKAAPPFGARAAPLRGIDERAGRGRGEGGWAGGRGGTGGRELGRSAGGVQGNAGRKPVTFLQVSRLSTLLAESGCSERHGKVVSCNNRLRKRSAISTACPVQNRGMEVP